MTITRAAGSQLPARRAAARGVLAGGEREVVVFLLQRAMARRSAVSARTARCRGRSHHLHARGLMTVAVVRSRLSIRERLFELRRLVIGMCTMTCCGYRSRRSRPPWDARGRDVRARRESGKRLSRTCGHHGATAVVPARRRSASRPAVAVSAVRRSAAEHGAKAVPAGRYPKRDRPALAPPCCGRGAGRSR